MKRNHCEILLREAREWHNEGIISASTLQQIENRYAQFMQGRNTSLRTILFLSLGALLIGMGIILLLAANWDWLSRPMRTLIAFIPLLMSIFVWVVSRFKNQNTRPLQEPLGIIWTLSIGSAIAIISQTYQISGSADNFVMTWAILTLPVLYATLAVFPAIGYFALLFSWVCINAEMGDNSQLYWLLVLLAFPAFRTIRQQAPEGSRFALIIWLTALISVAALGFTLEKALPGLWTVIYTSAFASLYLGGLLIEDQRDSQWNSPMRTLGLCGNAVVLYLLTFQWPWEDVGWEYWSANRISHSWQMVFDFVLAFGLPLLTIVLGVLLRRKWRKSGGSRVPPTILKFNQILWGAAPLVVIILYSIAARFDGEVFVSLVTTAFLCLISLTTMTAGLIDRQLRLINGGVFIFLAIVLGKFFTSDFSFTARGTAFVICGILFVAANSIASRRIRRSA